MASFLLALVVAVWYRFSARAARSRYQQAQAVRMREAAQAVKRQDRDSPLASPDDTDPVSVAER